MQHAPPNRRVYILVLLVGLFCSDPYQSEVRLCRLLVFSEIKVQTIQYSLSNRGILFIHVGIDQGKKVLVNPVRVRNRLLIIVIIISTT